MGSERFSGCWATAGVLLDKGVPRVSAKGTSYGIWKMGALDETEVSLFLFGDAHVHYSGAAVGSVFAIFNGNVRMDNVVLLGWHFDVLDDRLSDLCSVVLLLISMCW